MHILVVNAGSSSLKLRVLDDEDRVSGSADLPAPGDAAADRETAAAIASFGPVDAVGHRIVHGGVEYTEPVVIDDTVRKRLAALTDLAPLHQPKSLAALDAVQAALNRRGERGIPAVACFDTAFHATISAAAATYALPPEWRQRWDLRRYGFHGLSHCYASRRAAELTGAGRPGTGRPGTGKAPPGAQGAFRVITCHLGAGASLAAVHGGRCADTTMGFTPLEGLVMATRSGSVDPGLVLWLEEHAGMPPAELAATLEHRAGLLGLAGTADMREILELAARRDGSAHPARLALEVYLHRLRGSIAAMAAAMDGLDALVFTGGVGENSPEVRSRAAAGLGFLGVAIDDALNSGPAGDREIGAPAAPVRALVITAREDIEVARQVRALV